MKRLLLLCALAAFADERVQYPPAPRSEQINDFHGTKVADPYGWMEQSDDPRLKGWIEAENKLTSAYLGGIPERERIRNRVEQLSKFVRHPGYGGSYAGALSRNGVLFFQRQDERQNQPALYFQETGGPRRLLMDPNPLSPNGTIALMSWIISHDGKWLAYGLSTAGSDWQEIRVRSVETGRDLPDLIEWTKITTASWSADDKGFYYSRYPQPDSQALLMAGNYNNAVYYHALNTPQANDRLIYQRPDHKEWRFMARATDAGSYLIVSVARGAGEGKNLVLYCRLPDCRMTELIPDFAYEYDYLSNSGPQLFFRTTDKAPRGRVIAIDLNRPERASWQEIVAEQPWALDQAVVSGDRVTMNYLRDAKSYVRVCDTAGAGVRDVPLPGEGTVRLARPEGGALRPRSPALLFSFTSYTSPELLYSFSTETRPLETVTLPYDPVRYETRQVFYRSKDGTRVPMFLVSRKGLKQEGNNPVLLYGYGGFNLAESPSFRPIFIGWLDLGGVLAVANLRGGAEYGQAWHEAGTKLHKQHVFDDFISAAEWLIANRYTNRSKLAIHGRSNGGLLIGAVLNQRPDLFGAAVATAGVMDMLRFHKFTVGAGWISDYGSPDNPDEFKALYAYSPVHNVRKGTAYPPVLITTADHDDRVVPAHSFKYAAAMQWAQSGPAPVLIRIETSAGHGVGKPKSKQNEETADVLAFLVRSLGLKTAGGADR